MKSNSFPVYIKIQLEEKQFSNYISLLFYFGVCIVHLALEVESWKGKLQMFYQRGFTIA